MRLIAYFKLTQRHRRPTGDQLELQKEDTVSVYLFVLILGLLIPAMNTCSCQTVTSNTGIIASYTVDTPRKDSDADQEKRSAFSFSDLCFDQE